MEDVLIEIIRLIPILAIFSYLFIIGTKFKLNDKGWKFIIIGFGLILFATIIDITDNFEELNKYIIIGNTNTEAILEKVVGYLGGFIMLSIGFWTWIPKILNSSQLSIELEKSKKELEKLNEKLEETVKKRTKELEKSKKSLEKKNNELIKMRDAMVDNVLNSSKKNKKV